MTFQLLFLELKFPNHKMSHTYKEHLNGDIFNLGPSFKPIFHCDAKLLALGLDVR